MTCPRCQLLLSGDTHHREWADCVKALSGRLQIAETRRSAAYAEQQRERARRKAAQEKTVPSIVRRMEKIEAEMRRIEEISRGSWNRANFVVTEIERLSHSPDYVVSRSAAIRSAQQASEDIFGCGKRFVMQPEANARQTG